MPLHGQLAGTGDVGTLGTLCQELIEVLRAILDSVGHVLTGGGDVHQGRAGRIGGVGQFGAPASLATPAVFIRGQGTEPGFG